MSEQSRAKKIGASFLKWADRHPKAGPIVAMQGYLLYVLANRLLWVGARRASKARAARRQVDPWFAKVMLGAQQHWAESLYSDVTLCGLMTESVNSDPIRTLLGVHCWRCRLLNWWAK